MNSISFYGKVIAFGDDVVLQYSLRNLIGYNVKELRVSKLGATAIIVEYLVGLVNAETTKFLNSDMCREARPLVSP